MANVLTKQSETYRDLWGLVMLVALSVLLTGLIIWLLSTPGAWHLGGGVLASDPLGGLAQAGFIEATGIRVIRVSHTAGGGMVDMRYQVIDPDKAIVIHDTANPPLFINETTGQALDRPFHDHSSGSTLYAGRTYNEILVNEGGVIRPGDLITVHVGEASLSHIVVQ